METNKCFKNTTHLKSRFQNLDTRPICHAMLKCPFLTFIYRTVFSDYTYMCFIIIQICKNLTVRTVLIQFKLILIFIEIIQEQKTIISGCEVWSALYPSMLLLFNFKCWTVWVTGTKITSITLEYLLYNGSLLEDFLEAWSVHNIRGTVKNENAGLSLEIGNQFPFPRNPPPWPMQTLRDHNFHAGLLSVSG